MPTPPALNATWFRPLSRETLGRIAQELRTQWPEEDLKDHDQGLKQSSYWQDDIKEDINYEYGQEFTRKELE